MKYVNSIYSYLLFITLVFLSGCGGDNDGFPTGGCGGEGDPCPAYAVELTVTPQLNTLAVATDEQYLARATYSDGTQREVTAEVTWSSSTPKIASITAGGIASAETVGMTEIIATLVASQAGPEVSDSAILNVTDAAITSLTIEPGQAETLVGLTQAFKAVALFADSHKQDVTRYTDWSTSEPTVATISNEELTKGLATGVMPGTTQVLGSYASMTAQAQLVVLDSAVEKLVISPVDVSFPVGTGQQYRADLIFEDGLSMDVTAQSSWQSSVTAVASMNSEARLLGLEVGVTQVSASLIFADVNVSDSTSATVTQSVMTQLVVSPDNLVKPIGTQGDYSATAYYSDGSTADVTHDAIWSVDDKSIAVIVESGEMAGHATAVSAGTLTVTAAFEGLSGVVNAEVTDAVIESIELTPLDYITPAGTQVKYTSRARFSDASVHDITLLGYWQSSELSVANIGISGAKAGVAHAKAVGVTEISIDYMGLKQTTTLTVTDAAVSGLQVTPKNLRKPQGTRGQYSAIANYTDGHTQDVTSIATWSSANSNIVSIVTSGINGGYATANDVGTTVIQATYAGFKASSGQLAPSSSSVQSTASSISDSTSATVTNAVLEKLILSPLTASISAGNTQQYNLTGIFSDGSSKEVTEFADWQVESSNIAVIDGKGNALGLVPGWTAILASYLGAQAKAALIVTDAVIESLQVTPIQNQLPVGEKQQLIATAFYSDGHSSDVTQVSTWSSDGSSIVEVVSFGIDAGLAHALSAGDTSITANFDGLQASAAFVVTDAILESVTLSPVHSSVAAGNSQQYQFTGIFSDGSNRDLTKVSNWQSSEGSVASVNRFGLAQTYIDGTTQVKASYIGFSAKATLDVTDASLTGLQVTPANESVPLGTSGQYIAMAFYSDGHSSDVTQLATWSAVDSSIVNIIATGVTGGFAEAIGVGGTQVQASFETLADSVEVSVTDVVLESYVVSPVSATVAAGLTQTYQATGIFSDGSNKDLTHFSNWQSSEPSIATLDRKGLATSYTAGKVTVTAKYIGFTATAKLTVTDAELSFIQVTPANVKVPVATEGQFEAWAFYSDNHSEEITKVASWTSLNEDIVHIGTGSVAGGFASALTAGNTQIKAQFNGMSSTANVEVTAAEVLELTISPENKTVASGLNQAYQAFARFSDGTSKEVTLESSWQSSNLNAATIDMDGLAQTTIGGEYKTVIKATYKGLTAETNLYVGESVLVEIQVTPVTSKVNINEIQQYVAMAYYSDGFSMDLTTSSTWTIGDDSIAHVVPSGPAAGQVTGDMHGVTNVSAVLQGKTDSAEVVVTDLEYLGVDVEPADSHVIVNETAQMQALAAYQDSSGNIIRKDVTAQSLWSVGDRNKISINSTGLVTGIEVGESAVYADFQEFRGEGRLNVIDSEVISLKVTPKNLEAPVGTKGRYKATATMYNYAEVDVTDKATWSSSNTDVIHMVTTGYNGGMGTANSVGSSQITAEFDKSSSTVSTTVTPAVLEWIEITPKIDVIYAQVPVQFTATAYFSDDTSVDVTLDASWKSDSPQNAEMFHSIPGEAVGLTIGTSATISATYQGQSDSRLLSVEENYAVSVEVKPADISLAVGGYQSVEVWVTFADGTSLNYADYVEWSSTDSNVATGRKDIISGHKAGSAVVTATFDGESGSANVTVN
ncbi:Ig-like domain-containing protein [Shewanella eurypsychrophilus]|uniref:Ig-like domain-containing protein n=1 Tax=Shewanella eurypsychrophilus TaxID=2593656 RepID=A0ABX6V8T1_9GAMM|nr:MULTISPECIES: Ig-like domain-containing protein [Shewanella]QFU21611.1 cell surface protein [Shewanella sp. YLB-09]QPG56901.1 Ig-like domain-containing protein [Shewanella eurypsychrophilus]